MHNEKQRAKNYALRLLSVRSYSSYELQDKMRRKGYSEAVIEEWLVWLKRVDLLQDEALLHALIRKELRKGYGPRAMQWKLKKKGFSLEQITQAIQESAPRSFQIEQILQYFEKKGDVKTAVSQLIRRGFDSSLVFETLREFQ